jgi:signal transduction histidine kinase
MTETALQHERRRAFFREVLVAGSELPPRAFQMICDAWRTYSGAQWAWLWLFNEYLEHFELFSISPKEGEKPPEFITPGKQSCSYYTLKIKKHIEHVADVATWIPPGAIRPDDETPDEYHVVYAEMLAKLRCTRYDSVPLIDHTERELGVLTLHYRTDQPAISVESEWTALMWRFSARAILHALQAQNLQSLMRLNQHTTDALGHFYRPEHARSRYVINLVDLIRERTNADAVSVFFRSPMDPEYYECVGSTGLKDAKSGIPIDMSTPERARYRRNEGRTGRCIAENHPTFIDADSERPKYIDRDVYHRDVMRGPVLLFPIPSPNGAPPADGVIRCSQHRPILYRQSLRSFDAMEIEALRFVAEQASVVLGVCGARIRREHLIAAAKHDIATQIRLISNEIEELESSQELKTEDGRSALANLQSATLLARSVTSQLDSAVRETDGGLDPISGAPISINKSLRMLVRILGHRAAADSLTLRFTEKGEAVCKVDGVLFERAMTNILINAIQNAEPATQIEVVLDRAGSDVRLSVTNKGVLDSRVKERLFEFGSISSRKRGGPGSGVGLWAAREAVQAHDGEVELDGSAPVGDVRFVIILPARAVQRWEDSNE